MNKFITMLFLVALITGCGNKSTESSQKSMTERLEDKYAIGNIAFFSNEVDFDSIRNVFYKETDNPIWSNDMITNFPYQYNGFYFNNIKGIFSKESLLIGVVLTGIDNDNRLISLPDNINNLENSIINDYGDVLEAHQSPSTNDIKTKGEYTYKLWSKGLKTALITLSHNKNNNNVSIHYYIYRNDQINRDEYDKYIDKDLESIKSLM